MSNTDPLSFLETPEDPLSFLNESKQDDPLSFLSEPEQYSSLNPFKSSSVPNLPTQSISPFSTKPDEKALEGNEPGYLDKAKDYFSRLGTSEDSFGKALAFQGEYGGVAPVVKDPKVANQIATNVATIAAVELAFAPIIEVAGTSFMPRIMTAVAELTAAGYTGAATAITNQIAEDGTLIDFDEAMSESVKWIGISAAMRTLGAVSRGGMVVKDFNKTVGDIAKKDNISKTKVLSKLWDSTKGYVKDKFGRVFNPENVVDAEIMASQAKAAEKQGIKAIEGPVIEIRPIAETPPPPKPKPIVENPEPVPFKFNYKAGDIFIDEKGNQARIINVDNYGVEFESKTRHKIVSKSDFDQFVNKDQQRKLYRGYGRESKSEAYRTDGVGEPVLGKGKYYAFQESEAKKFGPNIENKSLDLKNPLVITSDAEWKEFTKQAGLEFPQASTVADIEKISKAIKKGGYDGVIVDFDNTGHGDYVGNKGRKTLRRVFGIPQVFYPEDYAKPVVEKPIVEKPKEKIPTIVPEVKPEVPKPQVPKIVDKKINEIKKQDITPKGLQEQKQYLLNDLENALANPTEAKSIKIEIPGDGVFNIVNNPEAIKAAIRRVEKKWPKKVPPLAPQKRYSVKKPKAAKAEKPLASKPEESRGRVPIIPKTRPKKVNPEGKKQAVARSKIIDILRKAFNDPIRLGKFRQRALGIHKGWPKITRLLRDNDVETAAHEIGHNLHYTLYSGDATTAKQQRANTMRALAPFLYELKPISRYEPFGLEGFAEFTRMYVTNPEVARELAPNFYNKFESDLEKASPEMMNALLEARDYYDQYLQGTPESRIRAQTSYAEDVTLGEKAEQWAENTKKFDNFITQHLDQFFPAKRMVSDLFDIPISQVENIADAKNLYRSLRVLKGAVGKADVFVQFETFDALTLGKTGEGFKEILVATKNKKDYREFNDYLIARRAVELHQRGIETGLNHGDVVSVYDKYKAKWAPLAKKFDAYNSAVLKYAYDSGLISLESYIASKKKNVMYASFQRDMKKGTKGFGSSLKASNPIKKIKGSTRNILPPLESAFRNTYNVIMNAEKNLTAQVLAKMSTMKNSAAYVERVPPPVVLKAKLSQTELEKATVKHLIETGQDEYLKIGENGNPQLSEEYKDILPEFVNKFGVGSFSKTENIITVYRKGKPEYYEVSPEIYEMWTKGTEPYVASLLTKIMRIPARTLRAGAILNPKFIQKNFIRDTWGSWLFTKHGKSLKDPSGFLIDSLYSPLAMMSVSAKKGPLYVEWLKSGGGMSTMQSIDRPSVVKHMNVVRDGYKPYQIVKWLRQAAEISEEANRLNEFAKALQVNAQTRLGKEIAAFASRDLSIDFAKMGLQAKAINQIISFYNATIQGGDKLVRVLANKEDRENFIPKAIATIVIPSLILAYLNQDDERIDEFTDQERDFNFMTFIGDKALKIPVPFETGVILHGLTQRMYNYFIKKDPAAFEGFMGSILEATLPNFIPNFADAPFEVWANKDFFRGQKIIPADKEKLISKYQYKRQTSVTARLLGRAMNYMLGEDTTSKAASPAVIDHFINSWTGGLGRSMIEISDASLIAAGLANKIEGPDRSIFERLGFDAFTVKYPRASSKSIDTFYNNYFEAKSLTASYNKADKDELDTPEEIDKGYERIERIYDMQTLQLSYEAMRDCQREINQIWIDPSIDQKLKEQMVNDLYLEKIRFAKAANEDLKKYRVIENLRTNNKRK